MINSSITIIDDWFNVHSSENLYSCTGEREQVKYFFKNDDNRLIVYGTTAFEVTEDRIYEVRVENNGRALVIVTHAEPITDEIKPNVFVFSPDKDFSYFDYKKEQLELKNKFNDCEDVFDEDDEPTQDESAELILELVDDYFNMFGGDEIRIIRCACGGLNFQVYSRD
jgi:hypothetical protein